MRKTDSKEMLNSKNETILKNEFINHTYSKSTRTDDIFKLEKDKNNKMNSIVQLYTNNNSSDLKLESNNSNKNVCLFNKSKDNLNFKSKTTFSYNTLFNKNLSSKYSL